MRFAKGIYRLGTETAFDVLVRAKALEKEGKDVIHLEIGEPDFDTPKNITAAAKRALDQGYTHYGPSAGLPELREAIAEFIEKTRGFRPDLDQIVVTPGGKPIIFFTILALIDPEDRVIYPDPGFPIYESMINFIGAEAVPCVPSYDRDFRIDIKDLKNKIDDRTRLIIINSPHNPTGGVLTEDDLKDIAEIVEDKEDLFILSDEIYSRITYDWKFTSISAFEKIRDRVIILDGFSKTYAMTGWRVGYGVMNKELAEVVARLQTNSNSCTATFSQIACIEALRGDQSESEKMVAEFKKRRDVIVERLNSMEWFECVMPKGAFYVFPKLKYDTIPSDRVADYLLNNAYVACLSGTAFGKHGDGYIRFSYANSLDRIEEAMDRVDRALRDLYSKK